MTSLCVCGGVGEKEVSLSHLSLGKNVLRSLQGNKEFYSEHPIILRRLSSRKLENYLYINILI